MSSKNQAFESGSTRSGSTYRWVNAWLIASAVIAVLLLANSIRDYLFVSRFISIDQVRHLMSQHAAALEQQLRQNPLARSAGIDSLMAEADHPLWVELRDSDGKVLEHAGAPAEHSFSRDDELSHLLNRDSLFKVVKTSAGDTVIEVFPLHAPTSPPPTTVPGAAPTRSGPRPPPPMLEIAVPLSSVRSASWPIRRNLIINCSGAIALLSTVVIAGLGFRSYAQRKHLEEQLEIARQVQSKLLPSIPDGYAGVQVATEYMPAEQIGGDFFDIFRLKDNGVALVMGDVSGKGVPAALLMGVIHGAVRSTSWSESRQQHEQESEKLNRLLCERASGDRYASMFWCYYDPVARSLRYVNAGHCPPLLARKTDGEIRISRMDAGGPVLGILPKARYEQAPLELCPGDVVVMYSDGLVEATNSRGEEYGEGRLRTLLATVTENSPEDIRQGILASLAAFSGTEVLRDDLTFVVAKF